MVESRTEDNNKRDTSPEEKQKEAQCDGVSRPNFEVVADAKA